MTNFIKFSDWETNKYARPVQEDSDKSKEVESENSVLLANLADLVKARKQAIRDKDDFTAQILEIDIKLVKIEIERNDLTKKKNDLVQAQKIAEVSRKEGKTNVKEELKESKKPDADDPDKGSTESYEPPKYLVDPAPGDKGFFMFKKAFDNQKKYFQPRIASSNPDIEENNDQIVNPNKTNVK
jgi:uncharacterized membrane protein YdbT with pleckstrin-like domain